MVQRYEFWTKDTSALLGFAPLVTPSHFVERAHQGLVIMEGLFLYCFGCVYVPKMPEKKVKENPR